MQSILVLNASYEPLSIVSAQRAVNLLYANKAVALDESDRLWHSSKTTLVLPYVIKMNYYVKKAINTKEVPFSRKGVLVRDNYRCAYCTKRADTIDHVIPKSRGGQNTYNNAVACCLKCNSKKADSLLSEVDMELTFRPVAPSLYSSFLLKAVNDTEAFASWATYVFMYQPNLKEHFVSVFPHLKNNFQLLT